MVSPSVLQYKLKVLHFSSSCFSFFFSIEQHFKAFEESAIDANSFMERWVQAISPIVTYLDWISIRHYCQYTDFWCPSIPTGINVLKLTPQERKSMTRRILTYSLQYLICSKKCLVWSWTRPIETTANMFGRWTLRHSKIRIHLKYR